MNASPPSLVSEKSESLGNRPRMQAHFQLVHDCMPNRNPLVQFKETENKQICWQEKLLGHSLGQRTARRSRNKVGMD